MTEPTSTPTPEAILSKLAELDRQIEKHGAAVFLLRAERERLRWQLHASGWKPEELTSCD